MRKEDWVKRLSQLRSLKREVNELSQRIATLENEARGGVSRFSRLPRGSAAEDHMAECAVRLSEMRDRLTEKRLACMEELGRLYAMIDDVDDSLTRRVLSFRYIDGLSWQVIAFRIGESDEQVPRRIHNRYLAKLAVKKNEEAETAI